MCIMWMPAGMISNGIVDKNDKIFFKKKNKDAHCDTENTKINAEKKTISEQTEEK